MDSRARSLVLLCLALLGSMQFAAGDLIRIVDSSPGTFLKHSAEVSWIRKWHQTGSLRVSCSCGCRVAPPESELPLAFDCPSSVLIGRVLLAACF